MVRRSGRGSINRAQVLERLRIGREGAIQIQREAKIGSPEYQSAETLMRAIDSVAALLTGDDAYFRLGNHGHGVGRS
jgi:hypothetical protein